jgi:5-methylcytosine-specific restriction protein A
MKLKTLRSSLASAPGRLAAVNSDSWRGTKTTAERGYGGKWQRERLRFLEAHPLCRMCEAKGLVVAADLVDHIEPHRGDQELFWNRNNWQSCCRNCHDGEKRRQEAQQTPGGWSEGR